MVDNISFSECINSKYINTKRMNYVQNGKNKAWDIVEVHDSICILLHHIERDAFVLVKQFRPPVFLKNSDGYTHELCAGIVDKDKSLEQITVEEVEEECGYKIDISRIKKLNSFYSAVGFAGTLQTLFFASLNESDKINDGGGIGDEDIEVVYLPVKKAREFLSDENIAKTPALMYSFMWYFERFDNG